jgi:regulator of replication initiation timing
MYRTTQIAPEHLTQIQTAPASRFDVASKDDLLHATEGLQDRLRQIEGRLDEIHRDIAAMQETVGSTHEQNVTLQNQLSDLHSAMMAEISKELKTIAQQLPHLPSPEVVKERTAQFFSETNQPLRLIDHLAFKRWVDMITPGVELQVPMSPELRQAILGQDLQCNIWEEARSNPRIEPNQCWMRPMASDQRVGKIWLALRKLHETAHSENCLWPELARARSSGQARCVMVSTGWLLPQHCRSDD